jgi:site-specific recombinase XerD
MSELFKKQIVRWLDSEGKRCAPGTPGATRHAEESRKWYGTVGGKHTPLSADKAAARRMLNRLLTNADLASVGLTDPFADHKQAPLAEHLDDFLAALEAKGDHPRHVEETGRLVRSFLDGVKAEHAADLDLATAQAWLSSLRADQPVAEIGKPDLPELPAKKARPALPAGWSLARVAELLGVKRDSVAPLVKRRNLPGAGNGKARRLPKASVEALLADHGRGASPETVNHHIRAVRSFLRWMVKPARRLPFNPLDGLEIVNADADRRRARRELTVTELGRLLEATRASKGAFRGLSGEDRFHLYATACGTGFRSGGLASLTPECFDLASDFPTVTLPVRGDKSRKGKVQPLPADVAELLRDYLKGKAAGVPVWPGTWAIARRAAEMIRRDLAQAGIPYTVEGADGPEHADFHALRHTYLTLGGRAGIDLRTLQELAGHSTPSLTARYTHVRLRDQAGAVEKLPGFLPQTGAAKPDRQEKAS